MIELVFYILSAVLAVGGAYGAILSRLKALESSTKETTSALTRLETRLASLPCCRSPPPRLDD